MRVRCLIGFVSTIIATATLATPPSETRMPPIGADEGLFAYRLDHAETNYLDIVTLTNGDRYLGKVMQWADQVLVFDGATEPRVFPVADVEQFEFRRFTRQTRKPELPDLTVAYVERLPRDQHWHGHVVMRDGLPALDVDPGAFSPHPAQGAAARFRIHVLNAGFAASPDVSYRVSVDGAEIGSGTVATLPPDGTSTIEIEWPWDAARHELRVELDRENTCDEIAKWNNTHTEYTDALGVVIVVARDRYEAFREIRNIGDTFCFEDWAQYQLDCLNGIFRASVYPSTPEGAIERVRCDRILVVDDPNDDTTRAAWEAQLHAGGKADAPFEYAGVLSYPTIPEDTAPTYEALVVDWQRLTHLCRQFGLIDLKATDTRIDQCLVRDSRGRFVQRRHLFPHRRTLMFASKGYPLTERGAAALNAMRGRPRGFSGDFLFQLPAEIAIDVRANDGGPLEGVQVDVYQLMAEGDYAGYIAGYERSDPLYSGQTDGDGRFTLLDQPVTEIATPNGYQLKASPFGKVAVDESNGLLLLKLTYGPAEQFFFVRLYDCNVAYLRGERDCYVQTLYTRLGGPESLVPPPYTLMRMEDRTGETPPLQVCWNLPQTVGIGMVEEFRIYTHTGFGDDSESPWTLVDATRIRPMGIWDLCINSTYFERLTSDPRVPAEHDTFYAVSLVDRQGRESSLAPPGCLAYGKDSISLAMGYGVGYISVAGPGSGQMMCWDGSIGTQPYGVRTRGFPGYEPHFAGLAVGRDRRLVVADPVNHVLAFYDRGELVELLPQRKWWPGFASDEPGEFYEPADVSVDENGRMFVADRLNDRVQILDSRGRYIGLVDGEFRFEEPFAVGYANGHLCVTDRQGTRCRVYDVREETPKLFRELPPLVDADRGLMSKSSRVYIGAMNKDRGRTGIMVFAATADGMVLDGFETKGVMGEYQRPRGLSLYPDAPDDWAFFVNNFPFDLRRVQLK